MDKSLKRGMCIEFESRKICIAGSHCHKSDLDIHSAEDKRLHVFSSHLRLSRIVSTFRL